LGVGALGNALALHFVGGVDEIPHDLALGVAGYAVEFFELFDAFLFEDEV